jgi:hypothetical protein
MSQAGRHHGTSRVKRIGIIGFGSLVVTENRRAVRDWASLKPLLILECERLQDLARSIRLRPSSPNDVYVPQSPKFHFSDGDLETFFEEDSTCEECDIGDDFPSI